MRARKRTTTLTIPFQILVALWIMAFLPRLLLSVVFFQQPIALDDMYQYDMLARSILEGSGYRWYTKNDFQKLRSYYDQFMDVDQVTLPEEGVKTAFRAPGYPLFLSGIYRLIPQGNRYGWTRVAQSAFTALLAPLTALIGIHAVGDQRTAVLGGLVMAWYPILTFYPLGLASENAFLPILAAGVLCTLLVNRHEPLLPLIAGGVLLGMSTLTRSVAALCLPFSAAWLWFKKKVRLAQVVLFLAIALGLCLPWAVRNTRLMGKPTFIETNLGYNLFVSYHPQGDGGFVSQVAVKPMRYVEDQARARYTTRQAVQFIRNDPGRAALRVFRKMAFFFGLEDREMIYFYGNGFFGPIPQPWLLLLYTLLILPWVGILFSAPAGMLLAEVRPATSLILGLIVLYAVPHFLILAEPRFHLALVPLLIPYAAHAWRERGQVQSIFSSGEEKWKPYGLLTAWGCILGLLLWHLAWHWDTLLRVMGPGGHQLHLPY